MQGVARSEVLKVHRAAQRLLRPLPVVNPYAALFTFLDDRTRTRRDHTKYLALIRTIALLHQYQRPVQTVQQGGKTLSYIEATLDDIASANALAHDVLGRCLDEMPPQTRGLLDLLERMVSAQCKARKLDRGDVLFSRRDVRATAGWSDTQLRVHNPGASSDQTGVVPTSDQAESDPAALVSTTRPIETIEQAIRFINKTKWETRYGVNLMVSVEPIAGQPETYHFFHRGGKEGGRIDEIITGVADAADLLQRVRDYLFEDRTVSESLYRQLDEAAALSQRPKLEKMLEALSMPVTPRNLAIAAVALGYWAVKSRLAAPYFSKKYSEDLWLNFPEAQRVTWSAPGDCLLAIRPSDNGDGNATANIYLEAPGDGTDASRLASGEVRRLAGAAEMAELEEKFDGDEA